ncbi:MAG TPA: threonine/serine exporter family protein, partial [Pseudomonadota bacterium]|nr:threonine/serine exporter family protein [Pseudomonadota bacterium]
MSPDEFDARVRFVAELARRLHQYGTSAPRLERAIDGVSARLGLLPTSLSTPTSITLSFVDPDDGELALPRRTMVMRVNPGDVNLRRLCEVDAIAERVLAQQIGITEGLAELRALRTGLS